MAAVDEYTKIVEKLLIWKYSKNINMLEFERNYLPITGDFYN